MYKNKVFLITSGTYANTEITSDFGLLPPSFLPIGHRRLIELQIENIKDFDTVKVITLPNNYKLLQRDKCFLENNNVLIHRNDPSLNLAQSILSFLDSYEKEIQIDELFILHGDTSFKKIEQETDLLYYGYTDMFYKWGHLADVIGKEVNQNNLKESVIAGYFTFSDPSSFKEILIRYNSFETALKIYNQNKKFKIILKSGWLDFGHSNLYYKSKMELNVTRNFNEVIANSNYIKKTSENFNKIKSEFKWFKQLPEELAIYTPSVWGFNDENNKASYKIEFIGAPTLQEKWVFGNLPDFVYYNIINQIFIFLNKTKNIIYKEYSKKIIKEQLKELYITKTKVRIDTFSKQIGFNMVKSVLINNKEYPPLEEFVTTIRKLLEKGLSEERENKLTLMHGDLCFSNILSDSRSNVIKLIDPRGGLDSNFNSENKIIGDYRYDIAKLGHSLIGNYDYIVAGFYNLERNDIEQSYKFSLQHPSRDLLRKFFYDKLEEMEVSVEFINASIINLFISMLPLHNEDKDRQIALLLNAYKLFYD